MAWPTTGAGDISTGYAAQGVTTIRWGAKELLNKVGTQSLDGVTVGIVTRFNERSLVNVHKLPNGDGLTVTRVQLLDGVQWDITVRDDTTITTRPTIGQTVVVVDGGGLVPGGTPGSKYTARVVENGYETAPGQPGEFTVTVEALTLIEGYTPVP